MESPPLRTRWERLRWRLTAQQSYGFDRRTAERLAFGRWWVARQGVTGQRQVPSEGVMAEYIFPIVGYQGVVNTHWGSGERGGSDIFAARGTPLVVMRGGRVSYAGADSMGGNNVLIAGDDGLTYYLAHFNHRPLVWTGQQVQTGQALGEVGDSGNAVGTGCHLHIGVGYDIHSGGGPQGGCGIAYDAVGLLQRTLAETNAAPSEAEMEQIAQLTAENAALQARLDAELSYSASLAKDTLEPTLAELEREQTNQHFDQGWLVVWADRLRPFAGEPS